MFDQLDKFYYSLWWTFRVTKVTRKFIGWIQKRFMEFNKEEANLRPKVETFKRYQQVVEEISDTEEMLDESLDAEMYGNG